MSITEMTFAGMILHVSIWIALFALAIAFLLTVWRVVKGPTLPDRIVALDMLVGIVIGFIALIAIRTGFMLYIDIAIALGLVGFLATVAFARFILAGAIRQADAASRQVSEPRTNARPAKAGKLSKKVTEKAAAKATSKAPGKSAGSAKLVKSTKLPRPGKGE